MKKLFALTFMAILAIAMSANAAPIVPVTYFDVVDPVPDIVLDSATPIHDYTHDIVAHGFYAPADTLFTATIGITLNDDQGPGEDSAEWVAITFDGNYVDHFEIAYDDYSYAVDVSLLQSDGLLAVRLTRTSGDFVFKKSELLVEGERDIALMPAPGALVLVASGLAGVAAFSRKKKRS